MDQIMRLFGAPPCTMTTQQCHFLFHLLGLAASSCTPVLAPRFSLSSSAGYYDPVHHDSFFELWVRMCQPSFVSLLPSNRSSSFDWSSNQAPQHKFTLVYSTGYRRRLSVSSMSLLMPMVIPGLVSLPCSSPVSPTSTAVTLLCDVPSTAIIVLVSVVAICHHPHRGHRFGHRGPSFEMLNLSLRHRDLLITTSSELPLTDMTIVFFGRYRVWASTCPFAARSTMVGMVVSYLLSFFLPQLDLALRSSAYFTIQRFEGVPLVISPSIGCSSGSRVCAARGACPVRTCRDCPKQPGA